MRPNSVSGQFLFLTVIFLVIVELLVVAPLLASYRAGLLQSRLERAHIASLVVLANPHESVGVELEQQLLANAGVLNIALKRNEFRELILAEALPAPVSQSYDLSGYSPFGSLMGAIDTLFSQGERVVLIIGQPALDPDMTIEATMMETDIRAAMLGYLWRAASLIAILSVLTASLLFLSVRGSILLPIKRVIDNMLAFQENPEDAHRIIRPKARLEDVKEAETALGEMQQEIAQSLRQKERLASLGSAVAKISHDLRNILTTAQLMADRLEASSDPIVEKSAPKLLKALGRAVSLSEQTLEFGKVREAPPELAEHDLRMLVSEVTETCQLLDNKPVSYFNDIPSGIMLLADGEQIYRVLLNLTRNAAQALSGADFQGCIRIRYAAKNDHHLIEVSDNGPGIPEMALNNLFTPFSGSSKKGGTGLGLTISAELVKLHGGRLQMLHTGDDGTVFEISLPIRHPKTKTALQSAAEPVI